MTEEAKEEHIQLLSRRNTETAFQAIRDVETLARETKSMIDSLNYSISTLNNRMIDLETGLNNIRIQLMGRGPTT